ncbi:MAG TPA: DUF2147 domain-containing protein [Phenylobacterium sp.]|nr:DUF2147 domain-containing protein [Phenylobacterium sp.]
MMLRRLVLAGAAAIALATPAQAAGSPNGDWFTASGSGKVRIAPCGDRLCGTVVWLRNPLDRTTGKPQLDAKNPDPALRSRPIVGLQLIRGFKPGADGRWTGGYIYDPGSGRTYASKLGLNPDGTLKVEGCISVICQAQTWRPAT